MRGRPVAVARSVVWGPILPNIRKVAAICVGRAFRAGAGRKRERETDRMKCRCAGRNPGFGSAGSIGESAHDCTGEFRAGETGSCNPAGAFVGRYVRMAVFVPCFRATVLPVI